MYLRLCQNVYLCIMSKYKKQSHVVWKCDYHIVWCPKYRFRVLSAVIAELFNIRKIITKKKTTTVKSLAFLISSLHFKERLKALPSSFYKIHLLGRW